MMGASDEFSAGQTQPGLSNNVPTCKVCGRQGDEMFCNGLGFYDKDVPHGHPDFNKTFRCPYHPIQEDAARIEKLRKMSNLDSLRDKTFASFESVPVAFSGGEVNASVDMALNTATEYADNLAGRWLVMTGNYGTGKTHLAAAIGNSRVNKGDTVLFMTAPDLLDQLRGSYNQSQEDSYDEMFERVRTCDLLILDDFGTENPSGWAKEKLFQLLNHRYNEKLSTVITTNTDLDTLDPRLRSRMLDTTFVSRIDIDAPDYRSAQASKHDVLSDLDLYEHYDFHNFDIHTGCDRQEQYNLQKALNVAQEYAQQPFGWLVLIGDSGTGKTHLAAAIARQVQRQIGGQNEVVFLEVADLLDHLRTTYSPQSPVTFDTQFRRIKDANLLVLDNMGRTDHTKPWVREKLMQIVNHRYVRRLPTIITTLYSIDEQDAQFATRLKDRRLVRAFGIMARAYVVRVHSAANNNPTRGQF